MPTMTAMKAWMQAATPEQQNDLAARAGTTRAYLYHLAGSFRDASAELAQRIERAALAMQQETKGALPAIYRTDLNGACRGCDFAHKCLGPKAVRSEFDYLPEESVARVDA